MAGWNRALTGCLAMVGAFVVACAPSEVGTTRQSGTSDRLTLRTWGGPAGPTFDVTLVESGRLDVVKHSLPVTPTGQFTESRIDVELAPGEAARLISDAAQLDDFAMAPAAVPDATNAELVVLHDGAERTQRCVDGCDWPQGEETRAWLARLNAHLPPEGRVF